MGLLGSYFWGILTVVPTNTLFHFILLMSGILLTLSIFGLAFTKTRPGRTGFTMIAGILGGIHGFLDLVLFPIGFLGIIMFAWIAVALLCAFAAFAWLGD